MLHRFHAKSDAAKLKQIARRQAASTFRDTDAINEGPFGAARVSDDPSLRGGVYFRVLPAYGRVVKDQLEVVPPADAEARAKRPLQSLHLGVDAHKRNERG